MLGMWNHGDLYMIASLLPIPLGLAAAYRFYKATFMDIVLKRGAALIVILALSIIYGQLLGRWMMWAAFRMHNPALQAIFYSALWLGVFSLYLPLRRRIYEIVDRYLFKRRDYSKLLDWFHERLRAAPDERALIESASEGLKEAFAADSARFAHLSDDLARRLSEAAPDSDILLKEQASDELYAEMGRQNIEIALAIRSGSEMAGMILIGPRAFNQGYLSEELAVLRAVGADMGRMIENSRLNESERRQAIAEQELRKLLAEAELRALRAQIDPHFFFNALNSVASLIGDDPAAAEALIEDIADLFRHSFRSGRVFITLGEEIELAETYLRIEKVRLGDRLKFNKVVPREALTHMVPALTIQPLVENAVKHGVGQVARGGTITLSILLKQARLEVFVSDTGAGIAAEETPDIFTRGVGMANVNNRLVGLYGAGSALRVDSLAGQGATVSFSIPLAVEPEAAAPAALG
jgi:signal transduction histidine kinase